MVKRIGTIGGRTQPGREERTITKDGLVLAAIAIVSIAFGVGLYEQVGLNIVLSATIAAAGFFVLFSLHYIIVQLSSSESMSPRISSLERVVARLARDMSQVEDISKEIAEFRSTCERIDQAHSQLELGGFGESIQQREEATQRLNQDVRRLDAQIRSLRDYFELTNQENKERLKNELQTIENHVKHVAENFRLQSPEKYQNLSLGLPPVLPQSLAGPALTQNVIPPMESAVPDFAPQSPVQNSNMTQNSNLTPNSNLPQNLTPNFFENYRASEVEFSPLPQLTPLTQEAPVQQQQQAVPQHEFQFTPQPLEQPPVAEQQPFIPSPPVTAPPPPVSPPQAMQETPVPHQAPESGDLIFQDDPQTEMDAKVLDTIRKAIGGNKIDLYLQPLVALPERSVVYYESLTRLRDENDQLMLPSQYIRIAESNGIMPIIDNVMLFRTIQVARKLIERGSARGLFCNLSANSIMDNEFFGEFLGFMDRNKDLAKGLFFDIEQSAYGQPGRAELEKLNALAKLGYRFSLDNVTNLNLDFTQLQRQGVRFIKVDSKILLNHIEQTGARIHIADLRNYLKRYDIELVAGKIEDETSLSQLLTYNIRLGQGFLFSEPRPVRPEIFKKGSSQQAA